MPRMTPQQTSDIIAVIKHFDFWEFNDTDWCCFSGAEKFPDGSEPWIGTLPVLGWNPEDASWHGEPDMHNTVGVIWDASGVGICGIDCSLEYFTEDFATALDRLKYLASRPRWAWPDLKALGWALPGAG